MGFLAALFLVGPWFVGVENAAAECIRGDCVDGFGTFIWPSGARYDGDFKKGIRHGAGSYMFADGALYVGEYLQGVRHGKGTFVWASKKKYVGEWRHGRQNGYGIKTWPDGRRQAGLFKENTFVLYSPVQPAPPVVAQLPGINQFPSHEGSDSRSVGLENHPLSGRAALSGPLASVIQPKKPIKMSNLPPPVIAAEPPKKPAPIERRQPVKERAVSPSLSAKLSPSDRMRVDRWAREDQERAAQKSAPLSPSSPFKPPGYSDHQPSAPAAKGRVMAGLALKKSTPSYLDQMERRITHSVDRAKTRKKTLLSAPPPERERPDDLPDITPKVVKPYWQDPPKQSLKKAARPLVAKSEVVPPPPVASVRVKRPVVLAGARFEARIGRQLSARLNSVSMGHSRLPAWREGRRLSLSMSRVLVMPVSSSYPGGGLAPKRRIVQHPLSPPGLPKVDPKKQISRDERGRVESATPSRSLKKNPTPPQNEMYDRGMKALDLGHYRRAIIYFDQALRVPGQEMAVLLARGRAYTKKGDSTRGIEDFNRVLAVNGKSAEALVGRAVAYRQRGEYTTAYLDLSRAIALSPQSAEGYFERGLTFSVMGRLEDAERDLNAALSRSRTRLEVYFERGRVLAKLGKYDAAIQDLSQGIKRKLGRADHYFERGKAYSASGQIQRAIEDFSQAIALTGDESSYYVARASLFEKLNQTAKECRDWQSACRLGSGQSCKQHKSSCL